MLIICKFRDCLKSLDVMPDKHEPLPSDDVHHSYEDIPLHAMASIDQSQTKRSRQHAIAACYAESSEVPRPLCDGGLSCQADIPKNDEAEPLDEKFCGSTFPAATNQELESIYESLDNA